MNRDVDFLIRSWEIIDGMYQAGLTPSLVHAQILEGAIYSLVEEYEKDGHILPESVIHQVEMEVTEYYAQAWKQEDKQQNARKGE